MKKKRMNIWILILLAVVLILIFTQYVPDEVAPPTEEIILPEQIDAQEWIATGPVIIIEGTQKRAIAAEWLEAIRQYLLRDEYNQEIGYITYDELMIAKYTGAIPRATKLPRTAPPPPAPVPVTVPIPTPPPVTIPTPVPTPTPTPTPPPPVPTPTPLPPVTTPTPVPTPVPGAAHCTNGIWDVDESDLDCGGSCNPCPPPGFPSYIYCWINSDCQTGKCDLGQAAKRLPAIDPNTGKKYYSPLQLQQMAGQSWIIPWEGKCV